MQLFIARHAWAYEHGDPRWPDDSQRPLELEGVERMGRVVAALAGRGFAPAIIATSPYVRCRQTAEIVAAGVASNPPGVELDALRPGSDFDALALWSAHQDGDAVCWVGHSPDVGRLAAMAIGDRSVSIRFAKGSVAAIRTELDVGDRCGELQWLATAMLLGL
jgi:phosphohistidine phosphatase